MQIIIHETNHPMCPIISLATLKRIARIINRLNKSFLVHGTPAYTSPSSHEIFRHVTLLALGFTRPKTSLRKTCG